MSNMEDILLTQQQIATSIEQTYTNFKKDSSDRKTADYIKRRLDTLDGYWREFQNNHVNLCSFGIRNHSYFTTEQYNVVKERYDIVRAAIESYQPASRPSTPILKAPSLQLPGSSGSLSVSKGTESKTEDMLKKQASNFRAFKRTVSVINVDSVSEKWELEDLLKTLQSRWAVIDSLHWELDKETEGSINHEYESMFSHYEQLYSDIKKSINRKLWPASHREKVTEKMVIPIFSGQYNQWSSFKDLFIESIHSNPHITNAQKMQFLKAKVRGEAERLIQHLSISTDNYPICWDILNNRYNNRKLLFTSHANTLLSLPTSQKTSISHIKRIHDVALESLNAIKNLGVDITSWDPLIVHILAQKLDQDTYNDYVQSVKQPRELPELKEFLAYLESKFISLETFGRNQNTPFTSSSSSKLAIQNQKQNVYRQAYSSNNTNKSSFDKSKSNLSSNFQVKRFRCILCNNNDHALFQCQKFLDMPPYNKKRFLTKWNICNNCLHDHGGKECYSEKRCRNCNGRHNTLLHEAYASNQTPSTSNGGPAATQATPPASRGTYVSAQCEMPEILLATALIRVQKIDGTYQQLRALIDQGSQASLISENAAQQLGIPRQSTKGKLISGIGNKSSSCKGALIIKCASIHSDYSFQANVCIMKTLTKHLPSTSFNKISSPYLNNIQLADPEYYVQRPIDLLLGAEVYAEILLEGVCKPSGSLPIAQQTRLGWILSGTVNNTLHCNVVISDIEDISKFWDIEDIKVEQNISEKDQKIIEFYKSTTIRRQNGQYEVRLPLKLNFEKILGHSRGKAIAQFKQLERKFDQQKEFAQQYKLFINEYIALGHMTLVQGIATTQLFLPHHGIHKAASPSSKFRVVFNASSKTSSGYSLNDVMEQGPNLQQDLQRLIIEWRQFKFAFTADLAKMFRYIWLNEKDQLLQQIVWRETPYEPLKSYKLATVTYGTRAAPFLAMMTLRQLANDERLNYRDTEAIDVLERSFFMDDLLYGSHNIDHGKKLQRDLVNLLRAGGFDLRKWRSNSAELLVDVECEQNNQQGFDFKQPESAKTLGLSWNPCEDIFIIQLKVEMPKSVSLTKRALLSAISKFFDPLGWISPFTTKLKILFQKSWLLKMDWDDLLPESIYKEWEKIVEDINNTKPFPLPRWLNTHKGEIIELHGFCDSSTRAMACVIYCKITYQGKISISLVAGKTKLVNTNKQTVTIPRLELCAALLLSKLITKVQGCLWNFHIKIFCWTDSMVVLGWLNGEPSRWQTFVANRVSQITAIIPPNKWQYVKSEENPADCASRGLDAAQLHDHKLWWQGPTWLPQYQQETESNERIYTTNQDEKKYIKTNMVVKSDSEHSVIQYLLERFSSYLKIKRILAWVLRFINKNQSKQAYLSLKELNQANILLIKHVQLQVYYEEINNLQNQSKIKSSSKILNLNPYLDANGLLRVGGRLQHALLNDNVKHPIILPSNSILSELIIDYTHNVLTFHGGPRVTSAALRQKYWLVGGNRAVKKRLRNCVTCRKHSPAKQQQLMGDLPPARCNAYTPFFNTGCDLTGHVYIKASKGRGIKTTKGYVVVFICMATKLVHLELVSDLSSSAFLAALKRMAARRGCPRHVYSDNGTNFVGSSKILEQEYEHYQNLFNDKQLLTDITNMQIEWHLNAPSWPSAGGIWEGAVRSLKHHLRRVIGEQKLTYEEYYTVLAQLEAVLNSRPLCPLTEDPEDLDFLTPSSFINISTNLNTLETESDMRTRWYLTQKIVQDIWRRWRGEYLTQLTVRSKWKSRKSNLELNDIVTIHDDNLPPGKWAMGRVTELHPGKDGLVRVVTLKTKNGYVKRPIIKLSPLPVNKDTEKDQKITAHIRIRNRSFKNSLVSLVTALLFFMNIVTTSSSSFDVTKINSNQTLYFDRIANMQLMRDEWKLVSYYNMDPYWQGLLACEQYIAYLNSICMTIKDNTHCKILTIQLEQEFSELNYYNTMLLSQHSSTREHARQRRRRGLIDGVGYLANSLFGVLDARFAEQYQSDIQLARDNEHHLASLIKNQTSIIEAEFNVLKRHQDSIDMQHKMLNQLSLKLESIASETNKEIRSNYIISDFSLGALAASNILRHLKTIQTTLLDTITDIYHGRFNLHLISPEQLKKELSIISSHLPKDLSLPVNTQTDLKNIYHLLKVRTRMSDDYLMFEIRLPLVSRDAYEIMRIIPIPRATNNSMISVIPIAEYVAINLHKDYYLPLSQYDIQTCRQDDIDSFICFIRKPVFHITNNEKFCFITPSTGKCQVKHSICNSQWIEIHKVNMFFFFCCDRCPIRVLCDDQVGSYQLINSGIIRLDHGCIIKTEGLTVFSHYEGKSAFDINQKIAISKIEPINYVLNLSIPTTELENNAELNSSKDLLQIHQQIKHIQESTDISNRVSYHDIHHYAAFYTVLGASIIVALAFWWGRTRRSKQQIQQPNCSQKQSNRAADNEEIEMYTLPRRSAARVTTEPHTSNEQSTNNESEVQCVNQYSEISERVHKLDKCTTPIVRKAEFKQ